MEEPRKQATLMLLWKSFFSQDGIRDLRKPTTPIRGKAEPTLGLRHREAQSAYLLEWDNCFLTSWHGTLPGVGEIRREFEIPSKRCIEPCTIPVFAEMFILDIRNFFGDGGDHIRLPAMGTDIFGIRGPRKVMAYLAVEVHHPLKHVCHR